MKLAKKADLLDVADRVTVLEEDGPGGGSVGGISDVPGLSAALALLQAAATAATDTELAAAVTTLTNALSGKQDAASAATDTELANAVTTINTNVALKQDAASAATDTELAGAVSTINTAVSAKADAAATSAALATKPTKSTNPADQGKALDAYTGLPIALGSGLPSNELTKTANFTAAAGDLILADATTAGFTITLPTGATVGQLVAVKKVDASAHVVHVAGTIDGDSGGANISTPQFGAIFERVTSGWKIVSVTAATGNSVADGNVQDDIPGWDEESETYQPRAVTPATPATIAAILGGSTAAMFYRNAAGQIVPVTGTPGPNKSPVPQGDGTVAWTPLPSGGGGGGAAVVVDGGTPGGKQFAFVDGGTPSSTYALTDCIDGGTP